MFLQKLTVAQLFKKLPVLCPGLRFITVFTTADNWTLSKDTNLVLTPKTTFMISSMASFNPHYPKKNIFTQIEIYFAFLKKKKLYFNNFSNMFPSLYRPNIYCQRSNFNPDSIYSNETCLRCYDTLPEEFTSNFKLLKLTKALPFRVLRDE